MNAACAYKRRTTKSSKSPDQNEDKLEKAKKIGIYLQLFDYFTLGNISLFCYALLYFESFENMQVQLEPYRVSNVKQYIY